MIRSVWKYTPNFHLLHGEENAVADLVLPKGAKILDAFIINHRVRVWVELNVEETEHEEHRLWLICTGEVMPDGANEHIATLQWNRKIVHVYKR